MNKRTYCPLVLACATWLVIAGPVYSQERREQERLISASQAGALPAVFEVKNSRIPSISPVDFLHESEAIVRNGLPNFFDKLAAHKPVTVGYIGGSITRAKEMYREQSAGFIQSMSPQTQMKFINAGVAGSDTDLGVFRLKEQLLVYRPDLIFIEFAVNGGFMEGMEGMIRQIWENDPGTDICLIYTVTAGQLAKYTGGGMPEGIQALETLAAHYGIPSVHLGLRVLALEQSGKLIAKGDPEVTKDKIVFSKDGVHPLREGGDLYASVIAGAMLKMQQKRSKVPHTIPAPLLPGNWEDAGMYAPLEIAAFSGGWTRIRPEEQDHLTTFAGWFPYVMKADSPGESFTFKFTGRTIGLFDIGGPEVGQLELKIDGKPVKLHPQEGTRALQAVSAPHGDALNRFNVFCNNRYRGQYILVDVEPGPHTATFTISGKKADKARILGPDQQEDITAFPRKYDQSVIYVGKILVRGIIN